MTLKSYFYINFIIQHLLYNEHIVFDEKRYVFFVVRGFEN